MRPVGELLHSTIVVIASFSPDFLAAVSVGFQIAPRSASLWYVFNVYDPCAVRAHARRAHPLNSGFAGRRLNHSAKVSHDVWGEIEDVWPLSFLFYVHRAHDTCGIRAHAGRAHQLSRPTP